MIDKSKCLFYRGIYGSVEYCAESHLLHGQLLGIPHLLAMYDGKSLDELVKDFMEAVDFHLLPDDYEEIDEIPLEQIQEGVI